MAADSDGLSKAGGGSCGVVVTCEGDIKDPRFPARLKRLLLELRTLLAEPHPHTLKVNKVEPWNSVRVTLSVPRAAAARLRALAAAGAPQLRALGILSVQLDGDAAVSLRLQHGAELRINTDNSTADDASTSRTPANAELLANLGGIGRLLAEGGAGGGADGGAGDGASTSAGAAEAQAASRDSFKSPNTVCPMDGKIPQNIPTPADRCEFPFGSMTQARVIHRKENTLGIAGPPAPPRAADTLFARPSTSGFAGPPPPYPQPSPQTHHQQVVQSPQPPAAPSPAPPTVAMSSPLLVNLLQNDAPAPQPRAKPPHPAKLDRLEDGQVELAVGRAPFEYRVRPAPSPRPPSSPAALPPPSPRPAPRPTSYIRRTFPARPPVQYRPPVPNATVVGRSRFPQYADSFPPPPPPPPYRGARPARLANPPQMMPQQQRVTQEDLQALMPPSTTAMDQKTQSSFQEFQRYQQQYIARQRAQCSTRPAQSSEWSEPYRDLGLTLSDLPDSCDLDQLLPTFGGDLNLDDLSDLDANTKLDFYDQPSTSDAADAPDALLHEITGQNYPQQTNGPYEHPVHASVQSPAQPPQHTPQPSPSEVPSKRDAYDESTFMPPPPVPPNKFAPASPAVCAPLSPFRSPPAAAYSSPSSSGIERTHGSSMPPPMKVPVRPNTSILTATVGSQASQSEIEEQNKQYLIKTLMRDDDTPLKEEKKPEEVIVAQVSQPSQSANDQDKTESLRDLSIPPISRVSSVTPAPEIFGIAKSIPEEDGKDDKLKNKLLKSRDDKLSQKGGKPRNSATKDKIGNLKDKIVRDGKCTKGALPRSTLAKPTTPTGEAPKSPTGEKESIKLRLKLDKNEPVVQPVYKADVSFVNQQKGDKSAEGELRVPPLHISLRGRNSAVIKNSKKEKKKFSPGDMHPKKIKIRRTLEEEKSHRRDSEESIASKSGMSADIKTDEYLKNISLNNHFNDSDSINEIAADNNVVFRMKTISKNAHIVTKHDYKLNNKQTIDLKTKKLKLAQLNAAKPEKERDKARRNDTLDKEGKYAQNEGYREMNNHDTKLPTKDNGANCDNKTDGMTVQSIDSDKSGASEVDSRMLKCKPLDWTLGEARASEDNNLKRTITESAITSPNGLLLGEKKRKTSHSSCPDPPVGSTNVGTIAASRVDSLPPASSQRAGAGAASPRRKDRPKDKSYCKLVAERNANAAIPSVTNATDKFGSRSPASQAQGEDSGIESMDALSEKSPNQASQSPPGPQRKERLDMPRSTSPTSVQRIIGVIDAPPASDELLERLSRAGNAAHYATGPPHIDLGDIEAELAKMHADHVNGDDAPRRPPPRTPRDCTSREATPILRDDPRHDVPLDLQTKPDRDPEAEAVRPSTTSPNKDKMDDFDPLPCRVSPPLYTYSNQEKASPSAELKDEKPGPANGETRSSTSEDKPEPKIERLQLKADFPDKSLLEQLLIEIPTPDYSKRPESPSPSALERVARTSVRTRSSSKMNSPADGARTPRLSPGLGKDRAESPALQPRNCLRSGSVDKTSPRTSTAPAKPVPAPAAKRKRRESESSCASAVSCEEGVSPGRPKKKPRRTDGAQKPAAPAQPGVKTKKDSDSDSDEPLICKVRGKGKGVRAPGKVVKGEGVGTRRSVRHGAPAPPAAAAPSAAVAPTPAPPAPPTPAPPLNNTPVRRKTRSAVGEGTGATPSAVRRRRPSRDGK